MVSTKFSGLFAGLVLGGLAASGIASAGEIADLGTARVGGPTYRLGLAIAKVAKSGPGVEIRVKPFKTASQALPLVNKGEVVFGLANAYELTMATYGEGRFAGNSMRNLRVIASLYPFKMSFAVRKDSGIESVADLKGRRVPVGFKASTVGHNIILAVLAGGGLRLEDITAVPVSDFRNAVDAFQAGRVDVLITLIGSGRAAKIAQRVGGLRVLSLIDDPAAVANMRKAIPVSRLELVQPGPGFDGIEAATWVMAYDYFLYTHADAEDDLVRAVIQAILEGQETLVESVPAFKWFDPRKMATDIGVPYHPAAEADFKSRGLWPAN